MTFTSIHGAVSYCQFWMGFSQGFASWSGVGRIGNGSGIGLISMDGFTLLERVISEVSSKQIGSIY